MQDPEKAEKVLAMCPVTQTSNLMVCRRNDRRKGQEGWKKTHQINHNLS